MNSRFVEHDRIAIQIAKELEEAGYSVVTAPKETDVPFSLGGYVPDLVATRGDDNLIVEIKLRSSPKHAQQYRKVIEAVESHPGWRFLIKTISEVKHQQGSPRKVPLEVAPIREYLEKAYRIIEIGTPELSIPYVWNSIIGLLRIQASMEGLDIDELTDRSLINLLYTQGVISVSDYERLVRWHQLRNEVVHSTNFEADPNIVDEAVQYANDLVKELETKQAEQSD